jgi:hypothetical protein
MGPLFDFSTASGPTETQTLPKLYQNFTEFDQFFIYRHALNQTHGAPNGGAPKEAWLL